MAAMLGQAQDRSVQDGPARRRPAAAPLRAAVAAATESSGFL